MNKHQVQHHFKWHFQLPRSGNKSWKDAVETFKVVHVSFIFVIAEVVSLNPGPIQSRRPQSARFRCLELNRLEEVDGVNTRTGAVEPE